jgi:hypothetical protein
VRSHATVLSQKFVDEVSPDASGRKKVAHGVSRGLGNGAPPSPPSPLPPARERGAEGGVRALSPRACALGYDLAPLPGLWNGRPQRDDFVSLLLTQDTTVEVKNAAADCTLWGPPPKRRFVRLRCP